MDLQKREPAAAMFGRDSTISTETADQACLYPQQKLRPGPDQPISQSIGPVDEQRWRTQTTGNKLDPGAILSSASEYHLVDISAGGSENRDVFFYQSTALVMRMQYALNINSFVIQSRQSGFHGVQSIPSPALLLRFQA